jgi:hypothetical protein
VRKPRGGVSASPLSKASAGHANSSSSDGSSSGSSSSGGDIAAAGGDIAAAGGDIAAAGALEAAKASAVSQQGPAGRQGGGGSARRQQQAPYGSRSPQPGGPATRSSSGSYRAKVRSSCRPALLATPLHTAHVYSCALCRPAGQRPATADQSVEQSARQQACNPRSEI